MLRDLDGHVRATEFAHPAKITILRMKGYGLVIFIQRQDLMGTECDADAAPLAPLPVDFNPGFFL